MLPCVTTCAARLLACLQDLIGNHLTMSLYNHTAVWPDRPDRWPRAIRCNGHLLLNGERGHRMRACALRKAQQPSKSALQVTT